MEKSKIILIGGGGHCRSCIDVIETENRFEIFGIIDLIEKVGQHVLGYQIIDTEDALQTFVEKNFHFLITIGHIRSNEARVRIFDQLQKLNARMPVIISPFAHVSKHSTIGEGSIVMHQALVNANTRIGENCIINNQALLEHDCSIGDQCHVAPGAILNGEVKVGSGSFIGSGSVVVQGIQISENNFIKANSLIKANI